MRGARSFTVLGVADSLRVSNSSSTELPASDTALSHAHRLHLSLIGFAIGALALAISALLGVWLAAALFHTAPGALA